jgi:hypothetical protein
MAEYINQIIDEQTFFLDLEAAKVHELFLESFREDIQILKNANVPFTYNRAINGVSIKYSIVTDDLKIGARSLMFEKPKNYDGKREN